MECIQQVTLSIDDVHCMNYLYLKQGDVGRKFLFDIADNSEHITLENTTAQMKLILPNGKEIIENCTIENGQIVYVTKANLSETVGTGIIYFILTSEDKVYSTTECKIKIKAKI